MKIEDVTPGPLGNKVYRLVFLTEDEQDAAALAQFEVLMEALAKYNERNAEYRDNWRRMGWRGMLVRVRERSERLWDSLWDADTEGTLAPAQARERKLDDAIDMINFAGFLVRAVRENNRDGSWWGELQIGSPAPVETDEQRAQRLYGDFRQRILGTSGNKLGTWKEITSSYKSAWIKLARESRA